MSRSEEIIRSFSADLELEANKNPKSEYVIKRLIEAVAREDVVITLRPAETKTEPDPESLAPEVLIDDLDYLQTVVKEFRKEQGNITQRAFADMVGLSPAWVSFVENGSMPRLDTFVQLAYSMKLTPKKLLDRIAARAQRDRQSH